VQVQEGSLSLAQQMALLDGVQPLGPVRPMTQTQLAPFEVSACEQPKVSQKQACDAPGQLDVAQQIPVENSELSQFVELPAPYW
jgi:hypothetical protein